MSVNLYNLLSGRRALIFDFDGTLVDSNAIKISAFEKTFSFLPERLEEIMAYCRHHHHAPRHMKFRHVVKNILKEEYTPALENRLLTRYAEETTDAVIAAPEISGARQFLERHCGDYETAVLSSTPQEMLQFILERKNLLKFFNEVRGAPVQKASWLKEFAKRRNFDSEELLFFGDTAEDASSSQLAGVSFVGLGKGNKTGAVAHIPDFSSVL